MEKGKQYSAVDTFIGMRRMEKMRKEAWRVWKNAGLHALVVPTTSITPTLDQVRQVPVGYNTVLGYYTNFVNLLDMCGMAVPNGFMPSGVGSGITFIAPAWEDELTYRLGRQFQAIRNLPLGATEFHAPPLAQIEINSKPSIQVAVCGAHMTGLKLNKQLTDVGASLAFSTRTAPSYRMFDISKPGDKIKRPGITRVGSSGAAVEVEVWNVPVSQYGAFLQNLKEPLTIGIVELEDGKKVQGFVCEAHATADAADITSYGGWRNYVNSK